MDKDANRSSDFYTWVAWANTNRKQLLMTVGAVLVVGALVGLYFMHNIGREDDANEAFNALKLPVAGRDQPTDEAAAQFAKVADDYPGTRAAAHAMLVAGGIYFEAGEYEPARMTFQRFLAEHPDSPLANMAAMGVATTFEAEGKLAEATTRYEEIVHRGIQDSTLVSGGVGAGPAVCGTEPAGTRLAGLPGPSAGAVA